MNYDDDYTPVTSPDIHGSLREPETVTNSTYFGDDAFIALDMDTEPMTLTLDAACWMNVYEKSSVMKRARTICSIRRHPDGQCSQAPAHRWVTESLC